jgi:hypothetical protein
MADSRQAYFHDSMTKTDGPATSKQFAGLGAWFLAFGLGMLMLEIWVGDRPFRGKPASWGLGETFSVMGVVVLCRAALLHRQQR